MDSEQTERLIAASDLPSLLAALAHATGDLDLAPSDLWLDPARALEPEDGWDAAQLERARALASAGLARLATSRSDHGEGVQIAHLELYT